MMKNIIDKNYTWKHPKCKERKKYLSTGRSEGSGIIYSELRGKTWKEGYCTQYGFRIEGDK